MLNLKTLLPRSYRGKPGYYGASRNMPCSCMNLPLNPKKIASAAGTDPEMSNDSSLRVLRRGGNYAEEQTCWQMWSSTNYSIQIHKAAANFREWHQFPTGWPSCLFFLFTINAPKAKKGEFIYITASRHEASASQKHRTTLRKTLEKPLELHLKDKKQKTGPQKNRHYKDIKLHLEENNK